MSESDANWRKLFMGVACSIIFFNVGLASNGKLSKSSP